MSREQFVSKETNLLSQEWFVAEWIRDCMEAGLPASTIDSLVKNLLPLELINHFDVPEDVERLSEGALAMAYTIHDMWKAGEIL